MGTNPHHHPPHHHLVTKKLITRVVYCVIPLALLHLYLFPVSFNKPPPPLSTPSTTLLSAQNPPPPPPCDFSTGRWIPTAHPPLYNGTTCSSTIKPNQNCILHGRPDTNYLRYRWRPAACPLPPFHPPTFLSLLRHKHLAFVGDSMARNQLESLVCLLSSHSPPSLLYATDDNKFRRWLFPPYNATLSIYWSPFLVRGDEKSDTLDHNKLYLDSPDPRWTSELPGIDVLVLSAGHWFLHPAVYYSGAAVVGCHHCPAGANHSETGFFEAFRAAVRTAVLAGGARQRHVVVTTFSPAHFEGEWDKLGACKRERPYEDGEKEMEYMDVEMRRVEVEEVAAAAAAEVLDVTRLAMLRPDGHPGPYMYPNPFAGGVKDRVQNDCVHWCLPGPIDTWNEILLGMMERW